MFGEKSIYGQSIVHFDSKKRIFLPKFTYVAPKDSLLIIDKDEYLSVYKEEIFEEKINYLENLYINSDLAKKKEIDLELLNLYSSILKKVMSDNQRRISLCGINTDLDKFLCIGAKDHIILKTKNKK